MKNTSIFFLFIMLSLQIQSQNDISAFMAETNLDSLVQTVRDLSGEDSTYVNGTKVLIEHRVSDLGNDLAADYIKERLSNYNLTVTDQVYDTKGRNIYATQTGKSFPDSIYIVCAHYDAWVSYAADDNASGVAAVIEAARILSDDTSDYTIIYALWDEEEIGLFGSTFYADSAAHNGENILGVLNMDMIGYDSDNDMLFDLHINNFPNSIAIKDELISKINIHNLSLIPHIINPGAPNSDHGSFWNQNFGAVFLGEAFFGGDPNPYLHTLIDRLYQFNLPYFKELSKLAVGTIASLAFFNTDVVEEFDAISVSMISMYPNPTNNRCNVQLQREDKQIEIFNIQGQLVSHEDINITHDNTSKDIDISNLPNALYIIKVTGDRGVKVGRVIKN